MVSTFEHRWCSGNHEQREELLETARKQIAAYDKVKSDERMALYRLDFLLIYGEDFHERTKGWTLAEKRNQMRRLRQMYNERKTI